MTDEPTESPNGEAPPTERMAAVPSGVAPVPGPATPQPKPTHAKEISTATSAAAAAGAAAARVAAEEEWRAPKQTGQRLVLAALITAWGFACFAALATVIYQNTPMSDAALRQAIAQLPFQGYYVPRGPIVADTIISAYMQPEEDYGILTIGTVRIALSDAEDYAWGNYELNVNPTANSPYNTQMNNGGPDFEFRTWVEGTTSYCKWNRVSFSFSNGKLTLQGNTYPVNGPYVTLFVDTQGQFVEAIGGQ